MLVKVRVKDHLIFDPTPEEIEIAHTIARYFKMSLWMGNHIDYSDDEKEEPVITPYLEYSCGAKGKDETVEYMYDVLNIVKDLGLSVVLEYDYDGNIIEYGDTNVITINNVKD